METSRAGLVSGQYSPLVSAHWCLLSLVTITALTVTGMLPLSGLAVLRTLVGWWWRPTLAGQVSRPGDAASQQGLVSTSHHWDTVSPPHSLLRVVNYVLIIIRICSTENTDDNFAVHKNIVMEQQKCRVKQSRISSQPERDVGLNNSRGDVGGSCAVTVWTELTWYSLSLFHCKPHWVLFIKNVFLSHKMSNDLKY